MYILQKNILFSVVQRDNSLYFTEIVSKGNSKDLVNLNKKYTTT